MKTIGELVDEYIGCPEEVSEDTTVSMMRDAYADGIAMAFDLIREEISRCAIEQLKFPILHLYDFMDVTQGRKPGKMCKND